MNISDSDKAHWKELAGDVFWYKAPSQVLDNSSPPFYRWYPDGVTNACYNALDIHIENGRGDQLALIYDSPVSNTKAHYTFSELRDAVAQFAGALRASGVETGDRVLIYLPMVPEALIGMLACARLGAIHSVVFGGFASNELAVRIDDARPKVVLSASCGIEPSRIVPYKPLLDAALELAEHAPRHCVILQRPEASAELISERDLDWKRIANAYPPVDCVPVPSNHPLYVLYTSGTTGQPKGVVRDTGGSIVALKWSMSAIYNVKPGDVYWAASDVGWVVGHSYIVYGPLFNGNTTVIYEGKPVGTPDAGAFWRVISDYNVNVLFTAPTAIRAIRKQDPTGEYHKQYDMSTLQSLFLAGERCDPDTLEWATQQLNVPVIDHWWQTETGWAICSNCLGIERLPIVPGSPAKPVRGYEVTVLNEAGEISSEDEIGALAIKCPLPPGTFTSLWNADDLYRGSYFERYPGYYETGDAGYIDENGYVFVMARTDDVINVAGHRLATGAIEEVLTAHPEVAECAVLGVADSLKGQLPLGLLVLNDNPVRSPEAIVQEAVQKVREEIGPVAAFRLCTTVARLPKTRSGKVLRATMRCIADGESWTMPATIDEPAALEDVTAALKELGFAQ